MAQSRGSLVEVDESAEPRTTAHPTRHGNGRLVSNETIHQPLVIPFGVVVLDVLCYGAPDVPSPIGISRSRHSSVFEINEPFRDRVGRAPGDCNSSVAFSVTVWLVLGRAQAPFRRYRANRCSLFLGEERNNRPSKIECPPACSLHRCGSRGEYEVTDFVSDRSA